MKTSPQIALITCLAIVIPATPTTAMLRVSTKAISASNSAPEVLPILLSSASAGQYCFNPGRTAAGARAYSDIPTNTVESSVELARQAWTRFDYKRALDLLDRASRNAHDSPVLLAAYASVYLKAEEPVRARQYLDRAVKLDPDCPAALLGQAEARFLERDYAVAEGWLNPLLSRHPGQDTTTSSAHALLARIRLETGNRGLAEAEAVRAIEANRRNANALVIMAFVKSAERKPALVRSLARRALEIDPFLAGARRLLAQYLTVSAGYLQKVDTAALTHFEKGKLLEAKGHNLDALVEFEAATVAEPRYYRALIALAGIKLSGHDYKQAMSAASRALEV